MYWILDYSIASIDTSWCTRVLTHEVFVSYAENHFTLRKSFQYFLVENVSGQIHDCISILVNSFHIWLGAILENIDPVIQRVISLFFPVKYCEPKVLQGFGYWVSACFSTSCTNDLHDQKGLWQHTATPFNKYLFNQKNDVSSSQSPRGTHCDSKRLHGPCTVVNGLVYRLLVIYRTRLLVRLDQDKTTRYISGTYFMLELSSINHVPTVSKLWYEPIYACWSHCFNFKTASPTYIEHFLAHEFK